MEKKSFVNMDLDMYVEKLENGLTIYVVPIPNVNNVFANFSTDYGSIQREFVPIKGKKMIKVPDGIAHFLEHKMFEQENGIDPFTFFSERGSDANANTNNLKTSYLFSGPNFFEENMNYLLDYVQKPYFTDENVEKEKGIIEQEIKMYQDDPYTVLFEGLIYNMVVNHPLKYPIIGTIESINSVTKDDLYACYNTFYHPSNMFVTVSGNVDPEHVIEVIRENQSKKSYPKAYEIKLKKYDEPDNVAKKKEVKKMNVTLPKVGIGYKFNLSDIKLSLRKIYYYMNIFFDIKFGSTSVFVEDMKNEGVITDNIAVYPMDTLSHMLVCVMADSDKPDTFIDKVKKCLENIKVTEEELERKKKMIISALIYVSDNLYSINSKVMNNLVKYKKVFTDDADTIRGLNIDEFRAFIEKLSFDQFSTYIIKNKK